MAVTYDIEEARRRISRVFRYLQELHRVKTPPTVNLDRYEWRLRLEALPHYPSIQRGPYFGNLKLLSGPSEIRNGNFIFKVGRPTETECPPPSVIIEQWLKPGWNEAASEAKPFQKRKTPAGEETFEDSIERVTALQEWLQTRQQWAAAEKHVVEALGVFTDIFDLWGRFARESEKYQLFVGDGVLVTNGPDGLIRHPVLLQRATLSFNPSVPEFQIRETPDPPFLYTPLLRYLGIEGKDIGELKDLGERQHVHPLGGDITSQYFKTLVQQLWQNGMCFDSESDVQNPTGPYIYRQPIIFLGRSNQGFAESIDRFIEALPTMPELPEALLRVCGIETGREAALDASDTHQTDLLLTKHANPEQELVIHRLEETGAVLVQGPPGTGKSHTIANLIGHLLAEGKSILVTSHTSKALSVVRDHVARPLQSLCVSVFHSDEDSVSQLEESITGIVNYVSSTSKKKIDREIEPLAQKRIQLRARHDELRRTLMDSMADEYRDIDLCGEIIPPSTAARRLIDQKDIHDWIPGPLEPGAAVPLTEAELEELYALNAKVTAEDEAMLTAPLPDPEKLTAPKDFATLFDDINRLERTRLKDGGEFWLHDQQTLESIAELEDALTAATEFLGTAEDWLLECVDAGGKKGERDAWMGLVRLVEECTRDLPPKEELILAHGPKVKVDADLKELLRICNEIVAHLESGKKLKKLSTLLKPEWQQVIEQCKVDEGTPTTLAHFQSIRNFLEVRAGRENLLRRWERQVGGLNGAPKPADLGHKPEKTAKLYADKILAALNWADDRWAKCQLAFDRNGIDWKRLSAKAPVQQSTHGHILGIREIVVKQLAPILAVRRDYLKWRTLNTKREQWLEYLNEFSKRDDSAVLIKQFKHGIKKPHYDVYLEAWTRLQQLLDRRPLHERRLSLLSRLEPVAPAWAKTIAARKGPHDKGALPGDATAAWKYRHWQQRLDAVSQVDLDAVQRELTAVKEQLHEVSALYVEKLAWKAQLERTGLKQQQALNGWLALHKKMGKGTGKQVDRLREEARKTLVACRAAVPVWIMPLSRVVESFDLAETRFDVVIIDEASQSDVLGLVAFAIGRNVAVVGDHEQVSPYAVGHEVQTIQGLIDEMLVDIPNKQLYDGKTSVYDLARQSFGGTIRLLEHFRCVPDIMQFSNHLCYGGEIRALREASASQVEPHLVALHVPDGQAVNKVNREEGLVIASLISSICRIPEYDECTLGVICMVGTEQALYIDSILRRRLTVSEYQKRRLLCGNASQFQGDERDVILISMVDSPLSKPHPLRQRDDWVKVFNVAASRARDQLWVAHSMSPERDLKAGDLRLRLISHAMDPRGLQQEEVKQETGFSGFASEFEEMVYKGLMKADYRTVRHCRVGEYVIDLVVEGAGGKRVAVVCDGDRRQPPEELTDAVHRQSTLERLGWKFIRLRGSEFFRDPERSYRKLFTRLKEVGIEAIGNAPNESADRPSGDELKMQVIRKAEQIRSRWKETPSAPVRSRKADTSTGDEDETPAVEMNEGDQEAKTAA